MDFAKTVFNFYPSKYLKSDLLEPEQSRKSDEVFQDAVAVLLSLLRYSVVVLGKKGRERKQLEEIRLESGYKAGHADIVAFKENNKLFLIDCTIGIVDETKIRKMQQTVNYVSSEDDLRDSKVLGLIFSPLDCSDLRRQYYEDIIIIDSSRLRIIFDLMLEGKIDEAGRKFLHS